MFSSRPGAFVYASSDGRTEQMNTDEASWLRFKFYCRRALSLSEFAKDKSYAV